MLSKCYRQGLGNHAGTELSKHMGLVAGGRAEKKEELGKGIIKFYLFSATSLFQLSQEQVMLLQQQVKNSCLMPRLTSASFNDEFA